MLKKTKIVATVGPATESQIIIENLIKNGVNVFRFNMKHGTTAWHKEHIKKTQKVADKLKTPVGILIDLQGPEIRVHTKDEQDIHVKENEEYEFSYLKTNPTAQIFVPQRSLFKTLQVGDKFSIDDGFIRFTVSNKTKTGLLAKSHDSRTVKHRKGLNLFEKDIDLPSLIKEDIEKLDLATSHKVDYIALSFTRSKKDILTLRNIMEKKNVDAHIVAKVESQKALDNIDEIIEHSDAIMIARGDLGVEIPIEQVAFYQKEIITKCRKAHKPVIVATQMLQSMIELPIPTRAEASDVANAVFDGTDAVMLSGETATGKYPIKAVEAMSRIAAYNEGKAITTEFESMPQNATELIVYAAQKIAELSVKNINIDKIVILTQSGYTAKVISSFRPASPVIAATNNQKTVETLTLTYGVYPEKVTFPEGRVFSADTVIKQLVKRRKLSKNDDVLIIHGQHWQVPGQTNAVMLTKV